MKCKIALYNSDEAYSVCCPGLPGCWSQGTTKEEAMENIQDAIREYLAAIDGLTEGAEIKEGRDSSIGMPKIPGINLHSQEEGRDAFSVGIAYGDDGSTCGEDHRR